MKLFGAADSKMGFGDTWIRFQATNWITLCTNLVLPRLTMFNYQLEQLRSFLFGGSCGVPGAFGFRTHRDRLHFTLWIHIPNQVGTVRKETIYVGARRVQGRLLRFGGSVSIASESRIRSHSPSPRSNSRTEHPAKDAVDFGQI